MAKGRSKRRLWVALFLSALVGVPVGGIIGSWWKYQHLYHIPGRVEVFVGIYPDIIRGQDVSLLRLSQEIARHPNARSFVIRRANSAFAWDDIDWWETIYDRQRQTIVDGNVWAGDTEAWGGVSDRAVKDIAATTDSFKGFGRGCCENVLP